MGGAKRIVLLTEIRESEYSLVIVGLVGAFLACRIAGFLTFPIYS